MAIYHGDLFDVLPTLEANSIAACVTDPPYGIGFMGKKWDTFKPGEAERRIVPNVAAESENPNLRGRSRGPASSPSAVEYDRSVRGQREFQVWTEAWAREVFRVLKPGAHVLVCGAPRSYHRMASGLEDAGFEIRDCVAWIFGQGFPKSLNFDDGWGTALKPAHEPIVLARKPFKGSIEKNRAQHGTGAINVDACRLLTGDENYFKTNDEPTNASGVTYGLKDYDARHRRGGGNTLGRWPSNVVLDEQAAELLDAQSGELAGPGGPASSGSASAWPGGAFQGRIYPGEVGGASRFFYVAKPSRSERDQGCDFLPARSGGEATGREDGSAGTQSPRAGAGRTGGARNIHPTVKPVELMRYLVRLITPPGGTVIDPFCGSGTTGMACAYEGVPFIGIEKEAEYVAIAERRIASCVPLFSSEIGA